MKPVAKFISEHPNLTIIPSPKEVTRSVGGHLQVVKEDQLPFKFSGADTGSLNVFNEEDAEWLRNHRHFGVLFEEVALPVLNVASKKDEPEETEDEEEDEDSEIEDQDTSEDETDEDEDEDIEPKIVEEVDSFNSASNYLKNEWGCTHEQVNSKDGVFEQAERIGLVFPNYPKPDKSEDK